MLDTKTIEVEHPLIHLELFDVELAHEFYDFNSFKGHFVHLILSLALILLTGAMQVPLISAADLSLILLFLRVLKHLHNLS